MATESGLKGNLVLKGIFYQRQKGDAKSLYLR
jgi:hypothetical protein